MFSTTKFQVALADRLHGRKYDHYYLARCPRHTDYHPSLLIYADLALCKSCGGYWTPEYLLGLIKSGRIQEKGVEYDPQASRAFSWMNRDVGVLAEVAHTTLVNY